jgi:antitoxin (DNA-binding transcriptional repressor) of toxin-antitoxin stability system
MATVHISETEAAGDFAGLIAKVRSGLEVVIENARTPVAVMRAPAPVRRTLAECIAMLPEDSTSTIDEDFARDVQAGIDHRESFGRTTRAVRHHDGGSE